MRAVTIVDQRVTVAEHPDPTPGTGEVLVRVRAAGINGADPLQVRGLYPAPAGSPADIPGMELAGEVVGLGPVASRFKVGEAVVAVLGGGAQAELAVVHERLLMPMPVRLSWPEAGGCPETFTTAHDALFTQAGLRAGERLLVTGAAGGVGTAAVQLAHAAGARVCASVRAEALRADLARLGADTVVAPGDEAGHGPFDVVLELVGAPNLAADLEALATRGRIVVIGIGAGSRAELDLRALMGRRAAVMGSTLRARSLEEKALCARRLEAEVLPGLGSGALRVPVAAVFAMEEVARAYERFLAGEKLGKVVLEMTAAQD